MRLTTEEDAILHGKQGKAKQKAMEIVVALGNIYDADRLIPVGSVQVSGISYKNLGDAGLEFLEEWAESGAKVQRLTTLNPAGMDLERWQDLGFHEQFARKQEKVIACYQKFGIPPLCTCTPYLVGNLPLMGDHIAWAESSAVSFANSVLGARTNREGGPSALAAAIVGKTANYGLHLDENRKAQFLIDVRCPLKDEADYGALGYMVGKMVNAGIPFFHGISDPSMEQLKTLGAAMAASGAVALYHIAHVTPEADKAAILPQNCPKVVVESLQEGYQTLNSDVQDIDTVTIGCPHASFEELRQIASLLEGKKTKTRLWITTAMPIYHFAKRAKIIETIERAGGQILNDTCLVVAPTADFGMKAIATNSAKAACYAPTHCGVKVRYGNLSHCIQSAIDGKFSGK